MSEGNSQKCHPPAQPIRARETRSRYDNLGCGHQVPIKDEQHRIEVSLTLLHIDPLQVLSSLELCSYQWMTNWTEGWYRIFKHWPPFYSSILVTAPTKITTQKWRSHVAHYGLQRAVRIEPQTFVILNTTPYPLSHMLACIVICIWT